MDPDRELTEVDLAANGQRCEAATPGPWTSWVEGREHGSGSSFIMSGEGPSRGRDIDLTGATADDQHFIANARQDVPRLLAEVHRLHRELGRG